MTGNLKIDLWMSPDAEDAPPLDAAILAEAAGVPGSRWIGTRMPAGPTALPQGPMRELVMFDRPANWSVTGAAADAVWRWSGEQLATGQNRAPRGAGGVALLMMDVDPAYEEEFNAWYDTEHLPHVNLIPGILIARRFRSESGNPRYLNIFHAMERDVVQRPDFWRYRFTPWTQRMWPKVRNVERFLFQPAP
jgi:hypothetical protein